MIKNNVTRMLTSHEIAFEAYELPHEKLSGMEAASYLGVEPDLVFKTIVVTRPERGKPILALVPAPREVDLKKLSKSVGEKKLFLATQKEALEEENRRLSLEIARLKSPDRISRIATENLGMVRSSDAQVIILER